jgi:alcohol dehydrogenase YqhD (iron-dependent ADH family)
MKTFTSFKMHPYTDILFGRETELEAGRMIKKHGGSKILFIYGGGSVKKSGLYDRVSLSLKNEGLSWVELPGVQANPRRSLAEKGIKLAQDEKVDFLLAVGGGSVIDTAKAIGLALASGGQYWHFFQGKAVPQKMVSVGAICTISAAGSEMSQSSVILDDMDTGLKKSVFFECCRPVFAIMNPELTYTVSPYQTGVGAADIFAHTVNRYFQKGFPVSHLADEFAEGLMRNVVRWGPIAVANPRDYEARAELMMAATWSHNDLTGLGRSGPRGGEHVLEHHISSHYDTAHGAGLSVIMPAWLQYITNHGAPEEIARIAQFGVGVFAIRPDFDDIKETANAGLRAFRAWLKSLGAPLTLKELGVPSEDLELMVKLCMERNNGHVSGFVEFGENEVREIFASVLE